MLVLIFKRHSRMRSSVYFAGGNESSMVSSMAVHMVVQRTEPAIYCGKSGKLKPAIMSRIELKFQLQFQLLALLMLLISAVCGLVRPGNGL